MILFFGTRQVVRDDNRPDGGMQQCGNCGQYALFKARRMRTYFHLFWIPLFPLGAGEPIWECQNCRMRYAA